MQNIVQPITWEGESSTLMSIRDITQDKKRIEVKLINYLRNMMFKSFTHEIRTPFNTIRAFLDLAKGIIKTLKSKYGLTIEIKKIEKYIFSLEYAGIVIL